MLSFSLRVLTVGIVLTGTALALDDDQQRALDVHNSMRSWRGLEQLWWDDGLAWEAQQWADQLGYMGTLEHSSGGENLYMQSWSSDDALTRAAQTWLDEMYSYNDEYIPDGDFQSYGHYTQAMWWSTQRLGMGVAQDGNGGMYVVARYDPPGNNMGERPY